MSNVATTYWQAGLQTAIGTPVAATRKIYEPTEIPEEKRNKEYIKQSRQNFMENYDVVETHAIVDKFNVKGILNYKDFAWWAESFLKGSVTPTGAGPYTRVFNGTASAENLKPITFEAADAVGAFQIPDAVVSKWKISGKGGDKPTPIEFSLDLLASRLTPGHTMTAALSDRDLVGSYALFKHAEFFINDSAAAIGTTDLTSMVEFSIEGDNKIVPIFTSEEPGGYYTVTRRDERHVSFMVKLYLDSSALSQYTNKYRSNTSRYVQIKLTGASPHVLTWNFHTKFDTFAFPESGPLRQVAIMGKSVYDPTLGYDWQATLVNDVAAI